VAVNHVVGVLISPMPPQDYMNSGAESQETEGFQRVRNACYPGPADWLDTASARVAPARRKWRDSENRKEGFA
jgi:hypothetical protein